MPRDLAEEPESPPQSDPPPRHRRRWWDHNLITLAVALFVLTWARELLNIPQSSIFLLVFLVVLGWFFTPYILKQPDRDQRYPAARLRSFRLESADSLDGSGLHAAAQPQWDALQPVALEIRNIEAVPAFTTKDGSEIRELLAHRNSAIRWQSLAEARLPPGMSTTPHYHPRTEEIYYILTGTGRMQLEGDVSVVGPGDAIAIPPGMRHQITNTDIVPLVFLCCCAPPYEHEDTVLLDDWPERSQRH